MIQGFSYFPTIVYRDEKPEWVENTKKITQKYFDLFSNEKNMCQTENMLDNLEIKFLMDYLIVNSRDILYTEGYDIEKYNFFVSALWGQEIKGYSGTDVHIHKNSLLCGWYFLETPENGSYPVYYDTRMGKEFVELDYVQGEEITNATSKIHFNNVVPGTFLFANSWMKHQLTPNMNDKPTKALHFLISYGYK